MATEIPFLEAHRIASVLVQSAMQATGSRNMAIVGTSLALGRLTTEQDRTQEEEIKFVEDTLSWCKAYWHQGRPS